ncbi:MAG TPA: cupin domain-containing protein [Microbacterium sp.]|uniref:cupin domain-containing protein n=1 Tax=Microbacterium sp. TaxID=51671 RepID=UPI002C4BA7B2|nr:cupin domain-containing protein [Microbacterium sp.]HWI30053.1 cupin domain-containing protein [Microbacterium sp.]
MQMIVSEAREVQLGEFAQKPTALTPDLVEASVDLWTEGDASAGYWECSPGTFTAVRDGYTEVCEIAWGSATIQPDDGDPVLITAGSTLIMPDGWRGTWTVHEQLRKLFVIVPTFR